MRRRREPAQTFVIAALAMASMIGALSMVVDAGIYFVLQRQLQNAADAAALAAVWYQPACTSGGPDWDAAGCQATNPDPTAFACTQPPNSAFDSRPCTAAVDQVLANQSVALSLCAGPNLPTGTIPVTIDAHPGPRLNIPQVGTYVVSLSCDAPHWFGRIFPDIAQNHLTMHIGASASAALGWLTPSGNVQGGVTQPPGPPPAPLVARLII